MTRPLTAAALFSRSLSRRWLPEEPAPSSDSPLQIADLAWERGDYPAALAAYLRLLDSPDAASVLEPIALRTGELYQSTELTRDGAVPQFSPDGRHLLYETGPVASPHHPRRRHGRPRARRRRARRRWRVVLARQRDGRILEDGGTSTTADPSAPGATTATLHELATRPRGCRSTPERWPPPRWSSAPATR